MIGLVGFSAIALSAAVAFAAAGTGLYNGGLGQVAGNTQSFGVAVCNGGAKALTQPVPVSIMVNGLAITTISASPIAAGSCAYSYVAYSSFQMSPGKAYQVAVAIGSSKQPATYLITVPTNTAATAPVVHGADQTANANTQSGDFFSIMGNWLKGLLGGK